MAAESVEAYERAFLEAKEEGIRVKALMLCNPHNPLGKLSTKHSTGPVVFDSNMDISNGTQVDVLRLNFFKN